MLKPTLVEQYDSPIHPQEVRERLDKLERTVEYLQQQLTDEWLRRRVLEIAIAGPDGKPK